MLWLIPGNPATLSGCKADRAQAKFFVEAAQLAIAVGCAVVLEGTEHSPVWNLSPFDALCKALYSLLHTWCGIGNVGDDQGRPVKRPTRLRSSRKVPMSPRP